MKKMMILMILMSCLLFWSGVSYAACNAAQIQDTPNTDFVNNGDGTVTHTKTGLMWKQCSEGLSGVGCATGAATTHNWQAALKLADTLNVGAGFAGFNDWRVPNIKELNSIVESQCFTPAINTMVFPNTLSLVYCSSSSYAAGASYAWFVDFSNGHDGAGYKSYYYYVRLVRGGQ